MDFWLLSGHAGTKMILDDGVVLAMTRCSNSIVTATVAVVNIYNIV